MHFSSRKFTLRLCTLIWYQWRCSETIKADRGLVGATLHNVARFIQAIMANHQRGNAAYLIRLSTVQLDGMGVVGTKLTCVYKACAGPRLTISSAPPTQVALAHESIRALHALDSQVMMIDRARTACRPRRNGANFKTKMSMISLWQVLLEIYLREYQS